MATNTTKLTARRKKRRNRAIAVAALTGTAVALLGVYIGFGIYYNNHFFPKTTIGDLACGNKTADYVESKHTDGASTYLLTVLDREGNKFHIAGPDFDYQYQANGEEAALLKKQNGFTWPVQIFRTHTYEMNRSFTYDKDALTDLIDDLTIFDEDYITKPEDARIDLSEDDAKVIDEVDGNEPIHDQVLREITQAVDNQETKITLSDACYEEPAVHASDSIISDTMDKITKYTASTVHYLIDGVDENLDSRTILHMLDISDDGNVKLNDEKLAQFVQHLASTYNTYGDVRDFKTSSDDTVKIGGGDDGWVISKSREAEQLKKDLTGGTPVEREPVYEQTAEKSGLDDIGGTYVEIDYTKQHLWYYKEGKLITETDIVSGNIARKNGSPDGVFKIVYKQKDATLVGENYASNVKYFMPFAYNVGIHDASWRSSFGKEIYKTSGSHGCINVPEKIAKKLYDTLEVGTPVIAFYRDPVTLITENCKISNAYSYKDPDKKDE